MPEIKNARVFFLMDRSGSMADRLTDAQGGYDTFIKEQQAAESERLISLWEFDTQHTEVYPLTPAKEIPVGKENGGYRLVPRGATALLDAIIRTVGYADGLPVDDETTDTIVVILTDGYENSSVEATKDQVKNTVSTKIKQGWTFIYLGANQDAIAEAAKYNIPMATAASFDLANTSAASAGTSAMMTRGLSGQSYSYNKNERTSFVGSKSNSGNSENFVKWVGDADER